MSAAPAAAAPAGGPVTALCFEDRTFYCALSLPELEAGLANGQALACWWYGALGQRYEERFVFYTQPTMIRTESDICA